ncbi:MAG: ABC transporter ATP-binding protein [Candidatus Eisenbacteria bacterium]|nr:ABC transporter ATP-binding protein [Candidatus Eisenbacteria bacterium]
MGIVDVRRVSMFFGGLTALNDVSMELREGEILGLIGPNGAGKTTLFNCINGFSKPSRGEVLLKGTRISGRKPHQICRMGLARTFQVVKPLQRMSTVDNVIASAFLRTNSKAEAQARALEILEFTGLLDDRGVLSKGLPLGKRKRLEIARALATRPDVLLLDESFAGLNGTELDQSLDLIHKIKAQGITILMIEHHMQVVMSISDRIVVLCNGEKIAEGTPREIGSHPQVIEAYLGEAHA